MSEFYHISVDVGNILNTIGLISDIVGALLLFKFGLPSDWEYNLRVLDISDEQEKQTTIHNNRIQRGANWGLRLLIGGFILQLIATWI